MGSPMGSPMGSRASSVRASSVGGNAADDARGTFSRAARSVTPSRSVRSVTLSKAGGGAPQSPYLQKPSPRTSRSSSYGVAASSAVDRGSGVARGASPAATSLRPEPRQVTPTDSGARARGGAQLSPMQTAAATRTRPFVPVGDRKEASIPTYTAVTIRALSRGASADSRGGGAVSTPPPPPKVRALPAPASPSEAARRHATAAMVAADAVLALPRCAAALPEMGSVNSRSPHPSFETTLSTMSHATLVGFYQAPPPVTPLKTTPAASLPYEPTKDINDIDERMTKLQNFLKDAKSAGFAGRV